MTDLASKHLRLGPVAGRALRGQSEVHEVQAPVDVRLVGKTSQGHVVGSASASWCIGDPANWRAWYSGRPDAARRERIEPGAIVKHAFLQGLGSAFELFPCAGAVRRPNYGTVVGRMGDSFARAGGYVSYAMHKGKHEQKREAQEEE